MTTPIALSPRPCPQRRRLAALFAVPLLALGLIVGSAASAGVASAATPASSDYRYLCLPETDYVQGLCVLSRGNQNVVEADVIGDPNASMTNWYYPTGAAYTTIRQANTQLCLQIDADDSDAVLEASCTTASYQQWDLTSSSEFRSEWNTSLCLTLGGDDYFYARTCDGDEYQIFAAEVG